MLKKLALFMLVITLMLGSVFAAFAKWDKSRDGDLDGYIRGVSFIDENKGWAVGDGGIVIYTNDGGAKWEKMVVDEIKADLPTDLADLHTDLYDVVFVDEKNGWACGDLLRGAGVIISTKDGGKTWGRQSSGTSVALYGIFFLNAQNGWAVGGNGTILVTNNGGSKWTILKGGSASAAIGEGDPGLWDVQFVTPQKGWITGENGSIKMTTDGGKTWVDQKSGTDSNMSALKFVNENVGWAVGEGAVITATTDGGKTWVVQKSGLTEEWFYGVDFVSDQDGYVVGDYGTIMHTIDGGNTWKVSRTGRMKGVEKTTFYDVAFPKPGAIFAVAQWGLVLKYAP